MWIPRGVPAGYLHVVQELRKCVNVWFKANWFSKFHLVNIPELVWSDASLQQSST